MQGVKTDFVLSTNEGDNLLFSILNRFDADIISLGGNGMKKRKKDLLKVQDNKKDAGNNQWTNANLKYYPDTRERQDGPGGN